jgi:hypothetical protein
VQLQSLVGDNNFAGDDEYCHHGKVRRVLSAGAVADVALCGAARNSGRHGHGLERAKEKVQIEVSRRHGGRNVAGIGRMRSQHEDTCTAHSRDACWDFRRDSYRQQRQQWRNSNQHSELDGAVEQLAFSNQRSAKTRSAADYADERRSKNN